MPKAEIQPRANRDINACFDYLVESAGLPVAIRFVQNANMSFAQLVQYPEMGVPLPVSHLRFAGLRQWRVNDFEQYLIFFYHPRRNGVAIVRVMHCVTELVEETVIELVESMLIPHSRHLLIALTGIVRGTCGAQSTYTRR